jgi:hypothetical protein
MIDMDLFNKILNRAKTTCTSKSKWRFLGFNDNKLTEEITYIKESKYYNYKITKENVIKNATNLRYLNTYEFSAIGLVMNWISKRFPNREKVIKNLSPKTFYTILKLAKKEGGVS